MQKSGASDMKRLLFDVSSSVMYIGYSKDDILIDFSIRIATRDHAKYLVDRIDQVLERNNSKLDDLDELIIGIGPGSYTGIRIAVMVGKMLAYAKHVKLKTVSSLFFMTSGYQGRVVAMMDARRGYVFSAIYDDENTIMEDGYRKLSEFKANPLYQTARTVMIDDRNYMVDPKRITDRAVLVDNIHDLIPNYLRKTEAETQYDQKSNN